MNCPNCHAKNSLVPVQKNHETIYRGRKHFKFVRGHHCMVCRESFIDPYENEDYNKSLDKFIAKVDKETKKLTCYTCVPGHPCPYRWDSYNSNGNCLAGKLRRETGDGCDY